MLGFTAGKASHNANNARGVTVGKMGRNSSIYNTINRSISSRETVAHRNWYCTIFEQWLLS